MEVDPLLQALIADVEKLHARANDLALMLLNRTAFAGEERRIDYGLVNDRLFVNRASLGLYASMVHEPGYRDAKATTALTLLPDILGQDATPFDLRFKDDDGVKHEVAQAVLVSNNAHLLNSGRPVRVPHVPGRRRIGHSRHGGEGLPRHPPRGLWPDQESV